MSDDITIRVLEIEHCPTEEQVINLPNLLPADEFKGTFSLLHCHKGVLSCLYSFTRRQDGRLLVVDVKKHVILLNHEVNVTKKRFARYNADYLYYGIYRLSNHDEHKRWVLYGYDLGTGKPLGENNLLCDLIGGELGSTICFDIVDGYFYAVSNQTTDEVEEVDWTSFYHCVRFPVNNPCKQMLEKTTMWRRQHEEGPLDDRWTNLVLKTDEASGDLTIVESRKELINGRRAAYKTKVVFPVSSVQSLASLDFSNSTARHALADLTGDRLALTLDTDNNPHFLQPQKRLPRNVHLAPVNFFSTPSKTPVNFYSLSANSFVDLVINHSQADPTPSQRLHFQVCSRRLKLLVRDKAGVTSPFGPDSHIGELVEEYEDCPVAFWPPVSPTSSNDNSEVLHSLMNPQGYIGKVSGIFDDNSLIYMTGKEGQLNAIVFVDFEPLVKLTGLRKWHGTLDATEEQTNQDDTSKLDTTKYHISLEASECENMPGAKRTKADTPSITRRQTTSAVSSPAGTQADSTLGKEWFTSEPAMYISISRGYYFP
jgi:hypothetical protein